MTFPRPRRTIGRMPPKAAALLLLASILQHGLELATLGRWSWDLRAWLLFEYLEDDSL